MAEQKTCFVVMGFGTKVDFQSGRKLNLDAAYRDMIKPAVEEAGLVCRRADEIAHSGNINVPMYREILTADVVVADLSTSNANAFYELGVRHALRPYTTIIIAENEFKFPFDLAQIVIRQYKHLGEEIGYGEVLRFRKVLKEAVEEIVAKPADDSPVYTFLQGLQPPIIRDVAKEITADGTRAASAAGAEERGQTHGALMQQVDEARKRGDFVTAKALLTAVRGMMKGGDASHREDPYIIQQLAFVTYKGRKPTTMEALEEARALLKTLNPLTSKDSVTLGLWGSVHKRLWEETGEAAHLSEAVRGHGGGYYLLRDHWSGINLAFLLNVRAARQQSRAEAVADFVQARRIRRKVLASCEEALGREGLRPEQRYWLLATIAEAHLGLGEEETARRKYDEAFALAPAQWMRESTQMQMEKLRRLLADSPLRHVKEDGE